MINLRDTVKDTITGFSGIVTSRTVFINGCVRIGVQSQKLKDGKPLECEIFDEQQLTVTKKHVGKKPTLMGEVGGPRPAIHQRSVSLRRA